MLSERFASAERARLGHHSARNNRGILSRSLLVYFTRIYGRVILRSVERARARARGLTARVVEVLPIRFAFDRRTFHLQQRYYLSRVSRFSYPLLLLLLLLLLFLLPLAGHIPVSHSHYVPPPPRADVRSCWNAMQRKRMAHGGQKSRITPYSISRRRYSVVLYLLAISREDTDTCATHLPIHLSRLSGTVYSSRRACTIVINHYVESGVDRKGLT